MLRESGDLVKEVTSRLISNYKYLYKRDPKGGGMILISP